MKSEETWSYGWKPIIRECRNYVPIIEGMSHVGAGLLVSRDGLIITNAHVVDGKGTLMVSLQDGTRAKGVMIHRDGRADLAIVKAAIHTSQYFELPDRMADEYDAGDEVLAIGHPRGLHFTSTRGIVSEGSRLLPDGRFVQTDVAINPGNSGGPLLDAQGNLVGINTHMRTDSQGLGFAIPGVQVVDYLLDFYRQRDAGDVLIPSDEQLAQLEQSLSPPELFEAAVELAELTISRIEAAKTDDWCWEVVTNSGNRFLAGIGKAFVVSLHIAELNTGHQRDENLLFQLLRWQHKTIFCRFEIDDDNDLFLRYARSFEDLDVSEACMVLLDMARAVDAWLDPLEEYFRK